MVATLSQALFVNVAIGLGAHVYYKRYEPQNYWKVLASVIPMSLIPAALLVPHTSSITSAIGLAFTVFITSLFASITLYRLSPLHPLSGYPGPILWRITKFAPAYYGSYGKYHMQLKRLHETYGPIVRVGPNDLSIIDKDLIPAILGPHGMPKGPLWEGRRITPTQNYNINNSLIAVRDLERHGQLRKPWNKAFGTGPMKDYEEMLVKRAGLLIERLQQICQAAQDGVGQIDLAHWFSLFAFDFMGDIAFASDFSLLQDGDKQGFVKNMNNAHFLPTIVQHIPWVAKITRATPRLGTHLRKFAAFAIGQAKKRAATTMMHKDLFYHLIHATDPEGNSSPLPLIISNAVLTIIAGSDTTSSTLNIIWFGLLQNPRCLERLRKEIDEAGQEGNIFPDKLSQLPYLNAVVNEGLRWHAPVPSSVQRAPKMGSGGKMLGSMFIPEGTSVILPPYIYHRDPRYFSPSPDKFWPERWLAGGMDDKVILERQAFIPFSYGPANCAGKTLALMELRYITMLLVRHFDLSLDPQFDAAAWEEGLTDRLVLCHETPLSVCLTKRAT